jgi:hypothetical protein
VPVKLSAYPDESDKGPYPIPDDAPIENWPLDGCKLADTQRMKEEADWHVCWVAAHGNLRQCSLLVNSRSRDI